MPEKRPARILIVEDEAKTAATVALYLRHAGMTVEVVQDGAARPEGGSRFWFTLAG